MRKKLMILAFIKIVLAIVMLSSCGFQPKSQQLGIRLDETLDEMSVTKIGHIKGYMLNDDADEEKVVFKVTTLVHMTRKSRTHMNVHIFVKVENYENSEDQWHQEENLVLERDLKSGKLKKGEGDKLDEVLYTLFGNLYDTLREQGFYLGHHNFAKGNT